MHIVTVNGSDWSTVVTSSVADSNLSDRALVVVAQIMDLDLEKESDAHLAESLLQQDKKDGPGGSEVIIVTPVTQVEAMVEAGSHVSNADTPSVTANSAYTSKTKVTADQPHHRGGVVRHPPSIFFLTNLLGKCYISV